MTEIKAPASISYGDISLMGKPQTTAEQTHTNQNQPQTPSRKFPFLSILELAFHVLSQVQLEAEWIYS